jgi:hypothetical protein
MRKWKQAILLGVLGLAITWLCTGGLVIYSYWFFPVKDYDNSSKPYIRVEVERRPAVYGVPFIYQYFGDQTPFGLRLSYSTHNVVEDPRITFDRFDIEFADGTETDIASRFKAGVVPSAAELWYTDDSHAWQKRPVLQAEVTVEDCIPKRTAFTLRLKGQLRSGGVLVETFDAEMTFRPHYETEIYSRWYWLVLSGA